MFALGFINLFLSFLVKCFVHHLSPNLIDLTSVSLNVASS